MVLIILLVSMKNAGWSRPIAIIRNDAIKEISITPMVPGNFMYLKFMYSNIAVKTMMRVMRLYIGKVFNYYAI